VFSRSFAHIAYSLVSKFAYGQTGSGKTFTLLGGSGDQDGLLVRAVKKLFGAKDTIEGLSHGKLSVSLSVELLEIYNEQVYDLLAVNAGSNGKEVKVTSTQVIGNVVLSTPSEVEVGKALVLAQKRRCVKATCLNAHSSRSHLLFMMHFDVMSSNGESRRGTLHIADLAGSERLKESGAHYVGVSASIHFFWFLFATRF
jgi:kinesin family member C1